MWLSEEAVAENASNAGHIRFRYGSGAAVEAYKADYARNLQGAKAILQGEMNENVTGEKGEIEFDAAVFPAADGTVEREERLDGAALQFRGYFFLVVRGGVRSVPLDGGEQVLRLRLRWMLLRCQFTSVWRLQVALRQLRPVTYRALVT